MGFSTRTAVVAICAGTALLCAATPSFGEGARPTGHAIQFSVQKELALRDFGALTIAYQRFIGPDMAVRLGATIDLMHDSSEVSGLVITEADGEVYDSSVEHGEWYHTGHLSCEWLWYRGEVLSLYYGGGPRVFYTSTRTENSDFHESYDRHMRRDGEEFGGGIQGCLGIQWRACEWLAIHAEYNARLYYSHLTEEVQTLKTGDSPEYTEDREETDRVVFDSRGVRVGLSAYF